ncbi:MAG: phosphomannomutase/phosphoglucomutase [Deltaproteobacteria bacterium]|jgi:phosphomannomutase|nr:phosphomannomutase/phosphoglucomutase [Deltaproteobacteria bacterium]MBW2533923.1 phosphomannomutase/phosphoglucomutase [Deltaproteobacteria bacterium]
MKFEEWKRLQNGSDIRGVAMEGVAGEPVTLTPAAVATLGRAFAQWLTNARGEAHSVALGTDPRLSGPSLKQALLEGLSESGFDVVDCGLASTPAMFMATIHPELAVDGAVMLTASHLPFNRNGMKFFTREGGFDKGDIHHLLELAAAGDFPEPSRPGTVRSVDFLRAYSAHLVELIRKGVADGDDFDTPLAGLKIVVDAGNGAGGFFADRVLEPLGADVSGSQFLEPDGHFPNHVPNPEAREAIESICAAVVREQADLGIIFDTDVDRSAIVDASGQAIHRNRLIALISAVVLEEHPGSVIVTDSVTSAGLAKFIEQDLGGVHHRYRRGYKNVIDEAKRLNAAGQESWLAIETSGHAALKENHFLDDGAYLVGKLLIQLAKMNKQQRTLASLITGLPEPVEARELRLGIVAPDFAAYGNQVLEQLEARARAEDGWSPEEPNYEGIRIRCEGSDEDGWFLLRMSLHDPVMPLNVESNVEGGIGAIVSRLQILMKDFDGLDLTALGDGSEPA